MATIRLGTVIAAPIERCFDLARSIDLHVASQSRHGERAIAGRTSGLIELDEQVTWRARHLGVWMTMTSRITAFDRPRSFEDSMVQGPFGSFWHRHDFGPHADGTVMVDLCQFEPPLGWLGKLATPLVWSVLSRILDDRAAIIRDTAESEKWRSYVPA